MWGTSSPDEKLTGDLGNVIEARRIGARWSDRLMAGKLSPGNFGPLQQYLPGADSCGAAKAWRAGQDRFQRSFEDNRKREGGYSKEITSAEKARPPGELASASN